MTPDWERTAGLSVETPAGEVGYDRLRRSDGKSTGFAWASPRDSVAVVALRDREDAAEADGAASRQVVLIEEYRPRLGETVVSCPVGALEDGESFEAAAARELREETGYVAGSVDLLDVHYPVSWLRKRRGVVVATDLRAAAPDRDDGEFTDPLAVPADEAVERVRGDAPGTGWTLAPLLLAREDGLL